MQPVTYSLSNQSKRFLSFALIFFYVGVGFFSVHQEEKLSEPTSWGGFSIQSVPFTDQEQQLRPAW
jgi:hypothetical protein